jgi:hypothetical protein
LVTELWEHAESALAWMERYGDRDADSFLEYQRSTDVGLVNQGWKDSWDAIRFRDGTIAQPPIALCEVQGYAYAARFAMADLYDAIGQQQRARELCEQAAALAARFDRDYWLPDRGYYALALDGAKRPVDSLASNAGQALWTGIVPPQRAPQVAEQLLGPELFTGWGVRTIRAPCGPTTTRSSPPAWRATACTATPASSSRRSWLRPRSYPPTGCPSCSPATAAPSTPSSSSTRYPACRRPGQPAPSCST